MTREKKRLYGPWSWTAEEINLLKKIYPLGKTKNVAEQLGRPFTAVRQKAYDMGLKTKTYQFWTDEQIQLLKQLYSDTSISVLSKRFNRSKGSIRIKAAQFGLKKTGI